MNEFSKYVRDLSTSLHTTKILYLGCTYTDDLSEFSDDAGVCGITSDAKTLENAVEAYPNFEFKQSDPTATPYSENEFDFVFTHKFFNYLNEEDSKKVLKEMYRISSKYIVNFELFSETKETFGDGGHFCGMYDRWLDFQVRIISNVQMHKDIDPEQSQFTLVRKTD